MRPVLTGATQPALEQSLDANAEWIKHARDEDTREEASYKLTDCSPSLVISGPSRKGEKVANTDT